MLAFSCHVSISLRSWRDFARGSFCSGSEAVNESGEAVRGLVKSFTRGFVAREIPRGLYGGSAAARSPAHESRQLRRLRFHPFKQIVGSLKQMGILCAHARDEWINLVRRHLLFLNALQSVFKRVIYIVRKILSRGMKDYNKFTHISNTVDIHSVCRDFG